MADDYKEPELVNATSVANLTSKETSALHDLLRNFRHKRGERHDASYLDRYIVSHPQAADRSALDGHLTGSILILDPKQRCLLTLHRKYRQWQQLGGHADGNFNLLAVAAREGLEESGLDQFLIDPVPIDVDVHDAGCFRDSSVVSRHFDICFAGKVEKFYDLRRSEESLDLKWIPVNSVADLGVTERLLYLVKAAVTALPMGRTSQSGK